MSSRNAHLVCLKDKAACATAKAVGPCQDGEYICGGCRQRLLYSDVRHPAYRKPRAARKRKHNMANGDRSSRPQMMGVYTLHGAPPPKDAAYLVRNGSNREKALPPRERRPRNVIVPSPLGAYCEFGGTLVAMCAHCTA